MKGATSIPDRLYMRMPDKYANPERMKPVALSALAVARYSAPKLSGSAAAHLEAIWGRTYFGLRWQDSYLWYQEMGIRPFVMRSLAGKVIPMWVEDQDGSLRRQNPKIKSRTTADGRLQVLIFRKAAKVGARKPAKGQALRRAAKRTATTQRPIGTVPASYPGAPGRINRRTPGRPFSTQGGGQIARTNVGVRWRHPGLYPRGFLHNALLAGARLHGLPQLAIYSANPEDLPSELENAMTMPSAMPPIVSLPNRGLYQGRA